MDNNKGNAGWAVLGFFIPVVGLILWLVWRNNKPGDARMAGKGALIGAIVSIVISIVVFGVTACMANQMVDTATDSINNAMNNM